MSDPVDQPSGLPEHYQMSPIMLVRLRHGVVGESQRTLHIAPVPQSTDVAAGLVAFCGLRIAPADAELLQQPQGQPCFLCLMHAPIPGLPTPPTNGGRT